jgi:hypothetical protein
MWPQVTQFETMQMKNEARLRLDRERKAAAQAATPGADSGRRSARFARLSGRRRALARRCEA